MKLFYYKQLNWQRKDCREEKALAGGLLWDRTEIILAHLIEENSELCEVKRDLGGTLLSDVVWLNQ